MIHLHCDEATLTADHYLLVEGWCVCPSGITSLAIRLGDLEVGEAERGGLRPDVALAFPDVPQAGRAGFILRTRVGDAAPGPQMVTILARAAGEEVCELAVPVQASRNAAPAPAAPPIETEPRCKLTIDSPSIAAGLCLEPIRKRLAVSGWALARGGVESIDILVNGQRVGQAYYGQRRPDVAAAFADWEGALLSGYSFNVPARTLRGLQTGRHSVAVHLRSEGASALVSEFSFDYERSTDAFVSPLFRLTMTRVERDLYDRTIDRLGPRPDFRFFLPFGDEDLAAALVTLESLKAQVYERWQVLLVPGRTAKGSRAAVDLIEAFGDQARVRTANVDKNTPLDAAAGCDDSHGPCLIGVLRPGDMVGCDALAEMAVAGGLAPDADFFYTDEIRISPVTAQKEPFFKPDWSPDLLLATNYIGRSWCARPGLIGRAGVTVEDLSQGRDYHVVLRGTEEARAVRHLPKLLVERGHAAAEDAASERKALAAAASRRRLDVDVLTGEVAGSYRLKNRGRIAGRVSIVIAGHGAVDPARAAGIRALSGGRDLEIIGVEPGPRDRNIGARRATGEFLLFVDEDVEALDAGWLETTLAHLHQPGVAIVGARLLSADRTVRSAGIFFTAGGEARPAFLGAAAADAGYFGLAVTPRNVSAISGGCLLVRRDLFERMQGFDEALAGHADLDFCLRVRTNGGSLIVVPDALIQRRSPAGEAARAGEAAFAARWRSALAGGDPYFNPNLSGESDDYRPDEEPPELVYAGRPLFRPEEIRRILALKLDHIGDFITALPAIRRLKRHFPGAEIYTLSGRAAQSIVAMEPAIHEGLVFEFFHATSGLGQKELNDQALAELRDRLRPYRFDLAVDLRKQPQTRDVLQLTSARFLAGFDFMGSYPWLDIALEWEGDQVLHVKHQHVSDDLLRLADAIALAAEPDRDTIRPEMRPAAVAAEQLPQPVRSLFTRRVVCVHPGVGSETRQWPPGHFAALIDLLVQRLHVAVVLIGGPEEAAVADEVLARVASRDAVGSLVGRTPLKELPALLAACALYVGNNSGPKHIAAAMGVPTIGIHSGVVDAREWGPIGPAAVAIRRSMSCSPCYLSSLADCPREYACMRQLEPAAVFSVCERMLLIDAR